MKAIRSLAAVELHELLGASKLEGLNVLHLSKRTSPVRNLKLIDDIEEIATSEPDMVLLLSEKVALGGWMVSAAIRTAWERRTTALIVPEKSFTESVVTLARRLDVSLLSSGRAMTETALDFALQVGMAQAGTLEKLRNIADRFLDIDTTEDALELLRTELGGEVFIKAPTMIETSSDDIEMNADTDLAAPAEELAVVEVELPMRGPAAETLIAKVPERSLSFTRELLDVVAPLVSLMLATNQLGNMRSAEPLLSVAALLEITNAGPVRQSYIQELTDRIEPDVLANCVVICLEVPPGHRDEFVVAQHWNRTYPNHPIARTAEGWMVFASMKNIADRKVVLESLRSFASSLSHLVQIGIGVSKRLSAPEQLYQGVREAWLAARVAGSSEASDAVIAIEDVSQRIAPHLLPPALAHQLALVWFPDFMAAANREELIDAVIEYFEAHGSVTLAAQRLCIHRNTLQHRLTRAQELGIPLGEADRVLGTHLVLNVLRGHQLSETEETKRTGEEV